MHPDLAWKPRNYASLAKRAKEGRSAFVFVNRGSSSTTINGLEKEKPEEEDRNLPNPGNNKWCEERERGKNEGGNSSGRKSALVRQRGGWRRKGGTSEESPDLTKRTLSRPGQGDPTKHS